MKFQKIAPFLLLMLFSIGIPSTSFAEVSLSPGFFIRQTSASNNGSTSTTSEERIFNLRLAYKLSSGVFFGAMIHNEELNANNQLSSKGVVLGYSSNGYLISYSQIVEATYGTYSEGSGYIIDFAYLYKIGGNFSLGPQLLYRSTKYTKNAGATADYSHTLLTPALLGNINF